MVEDIHLGPAGSEPATTGGRPDLTWTSRRVETGLLRCGLALFLLTYLPLARRFTTSRVRRWLSVELLITGFTVVVAISVYRVKYSIAAGTGGVGVVVGCVALFPLGDDRRWDRRGLVG
jgi:hypothetical protein